MMLQESQPDAKHMHVTLNTHNYGCVGFGNTNSIAMNLPTPAFNNNDSSERWNTEPPTDQSQQLISLQEDSYSQRAPTPKGTGNRPRTRTQMTYSAIPASQKFKAMPHVLYNGQKKIRDSYNFSQE